MWDWLKQADNLNATGAVVGAAGNVYSAYNTAQTNKKLMKQQDQLLALQKDQYNRGIEKEALAQDNIDKGFKGLSFGKKKKKTASFDLQTA